MFTGLIEEIGRMKHIATQGQSMILTIEATRIIKDIAVGDSIAVNGVCLTVIAFASSSFTLDVTPETFRKTNLKLLRSGSRVNLERAMPANGRFGGHIVQGHVDCVGTITSRYAEENAVVFRIQAAEPVILKYIIKHGSITVDGISLTIVRVSDRQFQVSIIPHTLAQTVLQDKQAGDTVNIECDLLGKYVEHLLMNKDRNSEQPNNKSGNITEGFLTQHGFM